MNDTQYDRHDLNMKLKTLLHTALLAVWISLACVSTAWASDAPAADAHGAKPADAHGAKAAPAGNDKPTRTYGEEPMFYLDSDRMPFVKPFHKGDTEDYYLCRGIVGQWYRDLLVREVNEILLSQSLDKLDGSTCAIRLIKTNSGKKRPIVAVDFYPNSGAMRSCVLGDTCKFMRSAVMYVSKDKTLYRSYIITDATKHINKQFCVSNRGELLAEKACWHHFE